MGYSYLLVYFLSWYYLSTMHCSSTRAFDTRTNFAQSRKFGDYKLISYLNKYNLIPVYIPKGSSSKWDTMKCVEYCTRDSRCLAFNFYESGSFYVCEFLEDNYCNHNLNKTVVYWQGNSIWEKLSRSYTSSCLDNSVIACKSLKPGCSGSWPSCSNCPKTCRDTGANLSIGYYTTTLWPDGPDSMPIIATCYNANTVVIRRQVHNVTGEVIVNSTMPFSQISSLYSLKQYTRIGFTFFNMAQGATNINYTVASIDSDGTLVDVMPNSLQAPNPLNFSTGSPRNFSFVVVTDDRYNCGSFWLVDPSNATYCPGGNTSIFGTPQMVNSTIASTGIFVSKTRYFGIDVLLVP